MRALKSGLALLLVFGMAGCANNSEYAQGMRRCGALETHQACEGYIGWVDNHGINHFPYKMQEALANGENVAVPSTGSWSDADEAAWEKSHPDYKHPKQDLSDFSKHRTPSVVVIEIEDEDKTK